MYDSLGRTQWVWNALGYPTQITDPFDHTAGYGYDAAGNLTSLTYPDERTLTYEYDEGNLLRGVLEGETYLAEYEYDAADRLVGATLGEGLESTYVYDPSGQLLGLTHEDADGLLASYDYEYDLAGNRTAVTETLLTPPVYLPLVMKDVASGGGESLEGGGEVDGLDGGPYPGPLEQSPTLDGGSPYPEPETGGETSFWQGVIDFFTRLLAWFTPETALAYSGPGQTETAAPAMPEASSVASGALFTTTIEYDYDPLYRLTEAVYSTGEVYTYTYDQVGNRTAMGDPAGVTTYQYDNADQLVSVDAGDGPITYTWDANGNLTHDGVYSYTYRCNGLSRGKSKMEAKWLKLPSFPFFKESFMGLRM